MEILRSILMFIAGIALAAALPPPINNVGIAVIVINLLMLYYYVKSQLTEKMCPRELAKHYCANCGYAVADYQDPVRDANVLICIPGSYCRRETTVEDDFHVDGLIF
jgi:hypothetical protein